MPLIDYLPETNLPDLFEPVVNPTDFQFPCCACKHRDRTAEECEGCAHYLT